MNTRYDCKTDGRRGLGSGAIVRAAVIVVLATFPVQAGPRPRSVAADSGGGRAPQPIPAVDAVDDGSGITTELLLDGDSVASMPAGVEVLPVNLNWYTINYGGATSVGTGNVRTGLSIGQNAVGEVAAGNLKLGLGFWYGTGAQAVPCACDCQADPKCDGVTNVFDVVLAAGVAFRGEAEVPDSSALCPRMTTDVDCDGVTKVFDVVHLVNVAFRGANPATEFCNPCAP